MSVTGNADPSGFFSSLGLRSGYPGGLLALSLDVTCTSGANSVPCIAAMDPSGTVNLAGLMAAPATSAAPEPGGMALVVCGILALALWRRGFGISG